MRTLAFLGALLVSLAMFGLPAPVPAQTPDGLTPANEGVCDVLKGGTPGLYGLCVAFCEAQDAATLALPITVEQIEALEDLVPSGRVLKNYNKKKLAGDPDMPCIRVREPCPCWDQAQYEAVVSLFPPANCVRWNGPVHNGALIQEAQYPFAYVYTTDHQHGTGQYGDFARCQYWDGANTFQSLEITPDELAECDNQIRATMAALNLSCSDSP